MSADDIKTLREANKWTQQQLAERLGVDQATVSRIERGEAQPSGPVKLLLNALMLERAA
jgi:transcriptional regulator with XRE-family HTH domain